MTVERTSGEAEPDDASDLCSPAMAAGGSGSRVGWLRSERLELAATIVLSFAVVLTAWSAFEAGKWSGVQAIKFSEAGAARIESARLDTLAGQLTQLDIAVFSDWSAAVSEDVASGLIEPPSTTFEPDPGTRSGFLYERIRPEFRSVIADWLETSPITNPDAPATPFEMAGYQSERAAEAEQLRGRAEELAAEARAANQNGDNYLLSTVLFASVLFFAGVTTKVLSERNRLILLGVSITTLAVGVVVVLSLPIEI